VTAKKSAPPVTTSKHSHEPAEVLGLVDSLTQIAGHGPHEQPHPHPFASEKHDHDRTYAAEDHKHDTVPEHGHDDRHARESMTTAISWVTYGALSVPCSRSSKRGR